MSLLPATVEIQGVRETLIALNKFDPKARRQFTKDAKALAQPLIVRARAGFPVLPPLSGMARGRLKWSPTVRSKITFSVSTKKPRFDTSELHPIFQLVQKDGAGQFYDMAGKDHTANGFVRNVGGRPSRAMWPAARAELPELQRNLEKLIDSIALETTRELET